MLFDLFRREALRQCTPEEWKTQWQSLFPPENRDVPITFDGQTVVAFVQVNHYVMMLQDGLLMEASFFDVCEFFQKAGYHVIWLMRCTQDIHNGYLKLIENNGGKQCRWLWKSPTTNFDRWSSDNYHASIVLQWRPIPEGGLQNCEERMLQRVIWSESDRPEEMIPGRTRFTTAGVPASPMQLVRWLNGAALSEL